MADTQIAVYYFPNYHVDARNEKVHGKGWTEWELVKAARPRFPGHQQPKVPLWGYQDEADPAVMAVKIDAAADSGITAFIFDWYWYDDGSFISRGLDEGFLGAANNARLKFSLMWANHDWTDIHPMKFGGKPDLLYPGGITPATWDKLTDYVIEKYFRHPSYWCVGGWPYFSIYELFRFVQGFGGVAGAREALAAFDAKAKAAGLPGVHFNAVVWGVQLLPGEQAVKNPAELVTALGFSSVTSYVWVHHAGLASFPQTDYGVVAAEMEAYWAKARREFTLPYYPNVTMGWDASPRACQSDKYENVGYPFMATMSGNTPERFGQAMADAVKFVADMPAGQRIVTVNAWNEWTEGSYLEPDTVYGMGYLDAIRDALGKDR